MCITFGLLEPLTNESSLLLSKVQGTSEFLLTFPVTWLHSANAVVT